jgi:gas vesicle protein
MADINSAQSGNFTSGTTWVGGVVPGVGDRAVVLAGHVVTINSEVTCDEVFNNNTTGYFDLRGGGILNANVTGTCITSSFGTVTILDNSGEAVINGNITHALNIQRHTLVYNGATKLVVNGNVVGAGSTSGGSTNFDIIGPSTGEVTVNGDVTTTSGGNTSSSVIRVSSLAKITINGTVSATGTYAAMTNNSNGIINCTINGDVIGNNVLRAISSFSSNAYFVVMGDLIPTSAPAATAAVILGGDMYTASNGALGGTRVVLLNASSTTLVMRKVDSFDNSNIPVTSFVDFNRVDGYDYPAVVDVREGTEYGFGDFEGTLIVPDPIYVSAGIPTDDTVGTAALAFSDIADAITAAVETITDAIEDIDLSVVTDAIDEAKDEVKDAIDEAKDEVKDAVDEAKDEVKDAVDEAKDEVKDAVDAKVTLLQNDINESEVSVIAAVSSATDSVVGAVEDSVNTNVSVTGAQLAAALTS